ncbi:capsule polysaccharide biosynthesis protein [Pyrenophora tritici-repentis]|uniref:Capsular polysaccharide synthesis protein n=2 Tax=Pyrenophora tritici-repentis TaxID=45151 RepID=A0A2W1E8H6_9PLEO|nr:uncharacterized protein PTRG_02919 [Pyrenophora tritici-repentis Pt-1C-BFP]KAI1518942.1 Capsular polysaccharide synthesis protein [Pyrenophora tritici-repentis]EDU45442.1 predicted protein [Pyrenophora tritici-repentis Pt-1C-BFP]KAI1568779.1 capsule polysaccharide biosynthesis protein [Pyrenophora tritici-repentis]KAI1584135.1 capsule polysaccharide biosynthesis protein [Pyrenophora tritici-repentis]KAI1672492.1 Capsular polysaccharide synthesis protein [Pyrenophora tritici-repentis]
MIRNSGSPGNWAGCRDRAGGASVGARRPSGGGVRLKATHTIDYPSIPGTTLSTSPASESQLLHLPTPQPPTPGSKSIFAFWHAGLGALPPCSIRNVVNWHRRFSPLGWTIYVLDTVPGSPLNVSNFIDTSSPSVVPEAFTNGTVKGTYAAQHTSDLIRFPLLLKYGGIYLDVGVLQFGDLDWLWTEHIANPASPYDLAGFTMWDPPEGISIANFFFMCGADNPLVRRSHHLLLKVWEGRTDTTGAHQHPLVNHVPLIPVPEQMVNKAALTDYAIQIQCMGAAQRWKDDDDSWDGPKYVREHCWLYNMVTSAFSHELATDWSGPRQWELLQQKLPQSGEEETKDQALARSIVENTVANTWCLKLGHGFLAELFGSDSLGMLWRKREGSDCEDGTYAGWLRWAEVNLKQDHPPKPLDVPVYEPTMKAKFLA